MESEPSEGQNSFLQGGDLKVKPITATFDTLVAWCFFLASPKVKTNQNINGGWPGKEIHEIWISVLKNTDVGFKKMLGSYCVKAYCVCVCVTNRGAMSQCHAQFSAFCVARA